MKTLIKIMALLSICAWSHGQNLEHRETETKEIVFEKKSENNLFYLSNINGYIKAEGYDGDKIILVAEKIIKAKTTSRLENAKEEVSIGIIDRLDTIIVYVKGPCGRFGKQDNRHKKRTQWGYDWNDCQYNYDMKINFTLKIPKNMNVFLSTVNHGDVEVKNINGSLDIHNVNGAIALKNVSGATYAYTINGDVDLEYSDFPAKKSYYYTLNGDINAYFPKGLKADMTFKSFNGDFYTNIEMIEYKTAKVEQSKYNAEKGISYKLDGRALIASRGGGIELDFETFNGDVYVKEK